MNKTLILAAAALMLPLNATAANSGNFFVRPYIGLSQLSDLSADTENLGTVDGSSRINLDSGFNAGIGWGYRYNEQVAVELAWEYRTNDSSVTLADNTEFSDGNYASNMFFLNGFYYPQVDSAQWSPYVGAGLSWMQEIDIDLEQNGVETSLSGDGDIGYQVFAGADYQLNEQWSMGVELRYGSTTGIDLKGEGNNGRYKDLDYQPTTLQLGLTYHY
ncbi:MAG: OmpW family outer membrane protein [Gammaproteobacteria bacterium]|nr:OmpW family outer membrane protein [Gammaproteobacteria bacterium]